jgi:ribonuclease Z
MTSSATDSVNHPSDDITEEEDTMFDLNRRDMIKFSGAAVGALALGNTLTGCSSDSSAQPLSQADPTQMNSLLASLPPYYPGTETLGQDEMRISFMGTTCIPMISQSAVSVFVELGNGDCMAFDMGTGSIIKYWAMGINMDKLSKIFLAHLHADHMGDLPFVYGFGPSYGRTWPLYVWGPNNSGFVWKSPLKNPNDPNSYETRGPFQDGTAACCAAITAMMRWHNESQSFQYTSFSDYTPPSFDPQKHIDAYDLVPFELNWRNTGKDPNNPDNVAYNQNGAKITHFPAVHTREGAISYKLEYNGMSMIYAGDTKPSQYMIDQALPGIDVLIHEIVMPANNWVAKLGGDPNNSAEVQQAQTIQDSSHTPQKAFGYILNQIKAARGDLAEACGRHTLPGHG